MTWPSGGHGPRAGREELLQTGGKSGWTWKQGARLPGRQWQQDQALWGEYSRPGRRMLELQRQLGPAGAAARLDALSGLGRSQFTTCMAVMAAVSPLQGRQSTRAAGWQARARGPPTQPISVSNRPAAGCYLEGSHQLLSQEKETPGF